MPDPSDARSTAPVAGRVVLGNPANIGAPRPNGACRVLLIGDVIGKPGREAVEAILPGLRDERSIDFVTANGENLAGGMGLTPSVADAMFATGVDVITSGNHIWDKKDFVDNYEHYPHVIRPANYPPGNPGLGKVIRQTAAGVNVAVLQLMGNVYMPPCDNPFYCADRELQEIGDQAKVIIVDIHCEATSEKQAFAWHLDGRASAVVGTAVHFEDDGPTAAIVQGASTVAHDETAGLDADADDTADPAVAALFAGVSNVSADLSPAGFAPRMRQFTVVGVFSSGHYEYDSSLAFVDNLGVEVRFDSLAALTAGGRRTDLLITVQLQDFKRNIQDALDGADDRTAEARRQDVILHAHQDLRLGARLLHRGAHLGEEVRVEGATRAGAAEVGVTGADCVVESGRKVVVFDIGSFRLITAIHWLVGELYVMRFLSHAEYDKEQWKEQL